MQIYRDNFERAYIEATEAFYRVQAPDHLKENGVQASYSENTGLQEWLFFLYLPLEIHSVTSKVECNLSGIHEICGCKAAGGGAESHQVPGELLWQRTEPD